MSSHFTEPVESTGTWAITALEHPPVYLLCDACPLCLKLSSAAVRKATVSGEPTATYRVDGPAGEVHSITVQRALFTVQVSTP
jgi:hypothetical protein